MGCGSGRACAPGRSASTSARAASASAQVSQGFASALAHEATTSASVVTGSATKPPSAAPAEDRELCNQRPSPLDEKLDIRIIDWDPQRLVARMPVVDNRQPYGLLHGGAVCSLVETVGSYTAAISAGPGARVVGIELNASYHLATTEGEVTATCTPAGSADDLPTRTFLIEVHDDRGRLTSTARLTCMVLSGHSS
jgi:1,4-dihydroxy-2-naphthoyl-CoA hydrolase